MVFVSPRDGGRQKEREGERCRGRESYEGGMGQENALLFLLQ